MPGGKSRKSGGVSKKLIYNLIKHKKVKEISLSTRELSEKANFHHRQAKEAWQGALEHAKQCGDVLLEAKKAVEHGFWKPWIRSNFEGSYETAKCYMRIAKGWDEPCLKTAREKGLNETSLDLALRLLRQPFRKMDDASGTNKKPSTFIPPAEQFKDEEEVKADEELALTLRRDLGQKLRGWLGGLHDAEVIILDEVFAELWSNLEETLRQKVTQEYQKRYQYNPYGGKTISEKKHAKNVEQFARELSENLKPKTKPKRKTA